ncbi:cation/calcium exchanger 1 [Juglans microcarpa x Juglans regia]|uniref:cation/calcium exchanger 1 n=1 Tax=Juglans microcarpa x Juglans regia TaxID=2249226 RepID=UPI001B7E48FB|nr:cation/calcium exchanger 1 [Juglans microcarpa x Juglans regia]
MASSNISIFQSKKLSLFLNISFLFLLSVFLKTHLFPSNSSLLHLSLGTRTISPVSNPLFLRSIGTDGCTGLQNYQDNEYKCLYVKTHIGCRPKGYISYLQFFYCNFGQFPFLGHVVLLLWLLVLFYLLGNTAANYFCSSLESLSKLMKLSPIIAGVTLLSLGNGASDVFASIVSFTRSGSGDVGLNSVLGGAFFISSVVVGIISILISSRHISVDKSSFIRDVIFSLFSLFSLLLIIAIGKINLWGAICFASIYFVYVFTVSATHFFCRNEGTSNSNQDTGEIAIPLLGSVDDEKPILVEKTDLEEQLQIPSFLHLNSSTCYYFTNILHVLELPLQLPRRLTIPVVSEESWSKPYAVISVTLAPLLLAAISNTQRENVGLRSSLVTYLTAGLIGMVFGNLAFVTTKKSSPPKRCLFPWLAGGFLMSVTWTYIIAEELVSLLLSIGHIIGINPSILGLTVLAWGNSLGDLIANTAMAINGGTDGVQIAISGCYAGPLFNVLMGIGLSLVLSSWSVYPSSFVIPTDPSLYETVGFLIGGLLWALVILPKKNMRLDRFLGGGLLTIYVCFLFLRLARALGLLNLHGTSFKL